MLYVPPMFTMNYLEILDTNFIHVLVEHENLFLKISYYFVQGLMLAVNLIVSPLKLPFKVSWKLPTSLIVAPSLPLAATTTQLVKISNEYIYSWVGNVLFWVGLVHCLWRPEIWLGLWGCENQRLSREITQIICVRAFYVLLFKNQVCLPYLKLGKI